MPDTPQKPKAKPATNRAHGRSLADFPDRSDAENEMIACARMGEPCFLGDSTRPEASSKERLIRAELIRFLALGGDDETPVHEKGVTLQGAWIEGELDCFGAELPHNLMLFECHFTHQPNFLDASGLGLFFDGSNMPGFLGYRLNLRASLYLREIISVGQISLGGAKIGGDLDCEKGTFKNQGGVALLCDLAKITGSVFLSGGFTANGTVRFLGAEIGGQLNCENGTFNNEGSFALLCELAKISGNVFLRGGFTANGEVRFPGAEIGGDFVCSGGQFNAPKGKHALAIARMSIKGALFLCSVNAEQGNGQDYACPKIHGKIALAHTEVGVLQDDPEVWPVGQIKLDGFRYSRINNRSTSDGKSRIDWLRKQELSQLSGPSFAVQPWTHLAKVLAEMGHKADAKLVLIEREKLLRQNGRLGAFPRTLLHDVYGLLADYGYHPFKPLKFALGVWFFSAALYSLAAHHALFGPSNPLVFQNPKYAHCAPSATPKKLYRPKHGNWVTCAAMPGEYTSFSPWVYSLDLILPVVSLGQGKDWGAVTPSPTVSPKHGDARDWVWPFFHDVYAVFSCSNWSWGLGLRALTYLEQLLGWVLGIVLAGALTGMFSRGEE